MGEDLFVGCFETKMLQPAVLLSDSTVCHLLRKFLANYVIRLEIGRGISGSPKLTDRSSSAAYLKHVTLRLMEATLSTAST